MFFFSDNHGKQIRCLGKCTVYFILKEQSVNYSEAAVLQRAN